MRAYVESQTNIFVDDATVAWTFEPVHWGLAGQGTDEPSALAALAYAIGRPVSDLTVVERIHGDENAFARDREPARPDEVALTLELLAIARRETVALVRSATDAELDRRDPDRPLPGWARWHTARRLAWHEPAELGVLRRLLARARAAATGPAAVAGPAGSAR